MESNRGEKDCRFSFDHYKYILKKAERCDYKILSCDEYHKNRESLPERYVILRHDIEHYPGRAVEFAKIEAEFGFISTYFVRVHAKAYNIFNYMPFSPTDCFNESCNQFRLKFLYLFLGQVFDPRENSTFAQPGELFLAKLYYCFGIVI